MSSSPRPGRARRWIVGLVVVLVAAAAGFGLRSLVLTPQQAVPEEPTPVPVLAEVVSGELTSTLTGAGQVLGPAPVPITARPTETGALVVTGTPLAVGNEVGFCRPLVEVSDRPLYALTGEVPAYRDLAEGDEGEDVARLQDALKDCGYPSVSDGKFGAQTAAAVRKLYRTAGYEAPLRDAPEPAPTAPAADPDAEANPPAPSIPKPPPQIVVFPAAEVVFLKGPMWVTSALPLGADAAAAPVIEVASGSLTFQMQVEPSTRFQMREGMPVTLTYGTQTLQVNLPTLPIAPSPSFGDSGQPIFLVDVPLPPETDRSAMNSGGSFNAVVGDGKTYDLLVPVTAIRTHSSGRLYVLRPVPEGQPPDPVVVEVIATAGGYSAVTGELRVGEQVELSTEG